MKKSAFALLILLLSAAFTSKSGKQAYQIFTVNGKKTSYEKMIARLREADVVLFGELHNNPICHWLEYEVTADLFSARKNNLQLGAEMFEADNQKALDSFLQGYYDDKQLKTAARLWPNYNTDYKPLVDFAKKNKLDFVASNIPRRYAQLVNKKGFDGLDTLSYKEKLWMAPLPMPFDSTLPGYAEILKAMGGHGGKHIAKAQASKDATMAYFITKNLKKDALFLHYNGTYHSNHFEGISWYLKQYKPGIKIVTIASATQQNINAVDVENKGVADFLIVIPETMTTTY